jgi:hypothetical protein
MKKFILLVFVSIVLLLFMTISVFAQESQSPTTPKFKKHSFQVSFGAFPIVGVTTFFLAIEPNPSPAYYVRNSTGYGLLVGSFNLEYNYQFASKFSTGYALSYSMIKTRITNNTRYYNIFCHQLFLKYQYYKSTNISLYSSLYLGLALGLAVEYPGVDFFTSKLLNVNSHVCFIGAKFKNNVLLEFGLGNQGIFKFGYAF